MRAVILATGYQDRLVPLVHHRPSPLLKVADKPILFHLLDYCTHHEINQVDIILHHLPEMIREKLGNGKRWGLNIHYHLARDPECPWLSLKSAAVDWSAESILLMQGDSLPMQTLGVSSTSGYFTNVQGDWSGWALLHTKDLANIEKGTRWNDLEKKLSLVSFPTSEGSILPIRTLEELNEANRKFLRSELSELIPPATAKCIRKGVWVSSSASIDPSASLEAPVFIGRNCQIAPNSAVGPGTVVENNSIIDDHSHIRDSLICQNSYVGQHLEIQESVVDRQWVLNLQHQTQVEIHDDWIVDDLSFPRLKHRFVNLLERGIAASLLLILSPLMLILWSLCRLHSSPRVLLPSKPHTSRLLTFPLRSFRANSKALERWLPKSWLQLPALINIFQGQLHFVGVTPKRLEKVGRMPFDWRTLYLESKAGLFTLSQLEHGAHPALDDEYVSEVYYIAHSSPLFDLKIIWRSIKKCFQRS